MQATVIELQPSVQYWLFANLLGYKLLQEKLSDIILSSALHHILGIMVSMIGSSMPMSDRTREILVGKLVHCFGLRVLF